MKTRERILSTSLRLFNEYGEPNVTTNHIADEMDISPGNLYYHIHNKEEIVYNLFEQFEQQIEQTLGAPQGHVSTLEDLWFYLHMVFETISEYRFLYRDLIHLTSRSRKLHTHFQRIVEHGVQTAITICERLVDAGIMRASREEIEALAINISLTMTFWLNFQSIRGKRWGSDEDQGEDDLARGIYQVLSLLVPFLRGEEQELLHKLSQLYLD